MRIFLATTIALQCSSLIAADVAGKWKIRIDGGGEIYSAVLALKEDTGKLSGTYEIDGRRARLSTATFKGQTLTVVVNTQRFSTPVKATFVADLEDGKLAGEVDFDSGSQSRAYDFVATRLGAVSATASDGSGIDKAMPEDAETESKTVVSAAAQPTKADISFRNGINGYDKALDAEIWAIAPSKSLLKQGTMTTDGNNGGGESQVLLRFEEIFGETKGKIPPNARIKSARLTVVAFDPGTTCYLHRLLVPWNESVTWDGMANGITVDNTEASTVRDGFTFAEINMDKQLVHFDVTPTVQLWAEGVENYGWVFVNTGGNGWDFYSSDWIQSEFRPMLEVSYVVNEKITLNEEASISASSRDSGETSSE